MKLNEWIEEEIYSPKLVSYPTEDILIYTQNKKQTDIKLTTSEKWLSAFIRNGR